MEKEWRGSAPLYCLREREREIEMALGNTTQLLLEGKDSAYGRLARIEAVVCITAALLAFLIVFGSFRRRFPWPVLRFCIWGAYVMSYSLISYAIGLMQSAPFQNELFVVWAVFLLIVLGSADSISAYSLEDNEQRWRHYWEILLQTFWVSWLIAMYSGETKFQVPLWLLWILSLCKAGERIAAYASASRNFGLVRYTKLVADFMTFESSESKDEEIDPTHMKGYHYLVRGEKQSLVKIEPPLYQMQSQIKPEVITVDKVWHCKGRLLQSTGGDPDGILKDICLSYALVKLLRRRFAGYPFAECHLNKTWKLVRDGLLEDHERTFRVIEVELSFLYDFFYTKYPVIFLHGFPTYKVLEIFAILASSWVAFSTLANYHAPKGYLNLITTSGTNLDVLVTRIVVIVIIIMEVLQLIAILFSDWARVMWVCEYVKNHSNKYFQWVFHFFCHRRLRCFNLKPWSRTLCQYSLLLSFHHTPPHPLQKSLISSLVYMLIKGFSSYRIELPVDVKKAVLHSLKANGRQLSNGIASLQKNGVNGDLSWACELETHTHTILVWHIATTLCEITPSLSRQGGGEVPPNFRVATSLSNYCAYLVAFVPTLLPDHSYLTSFIFDRVVEEVREILKGCMSKEKRYEEMMRKGEEHPDTITAKGVKLGRQLMQGIGDEELRWKVLADFWAEIMLFLAPSENATAHAEQLVNGGEFVTHIWALLSHAGILKRDEQIPRQFAEESREPA